MIESKEKYLTIDDISKRLDVSPSTVRRYIVKGVIPGSKLFNRYLVLESDFQEAIKRTSISIEEASDFAGLSSGKTNKDNSLHQDYLTIKEASVLLRCCEKTLYRKVEDRLIPSTKLWGKILIPKKDLLEFMSRSRREAPMKD